MREYLFNELENIDLELSRLSLKNLNRGEREYKKYLLSKIERISNTIMKNGKKNEIYKLENILRDFLFNYDVKEYYRYFNKAM
ncbi:hypothetical protein JJB75_14430 [Clostridium perfringens]|uniref:hypothetical protein n=1 Tax=Clostridium perfringens TaxID=1502 RepID=UPI001ABBD10D|nr:hypothetical protein [Clostridium perfringens]MBO3304350.1 hypothetical protein [Clostridium perfringens]MBO3307670.1 hypothetical protein [Clostridium perfringens]MBO3311011.1 hypothetical protein [Clostridium perfringens]MBO3317304.1 hypothetical protein [Clostridium perfringens]